ncbi:hypothetical protein E2C01_021915 [Portunus trituberculatus]|uniref:Uncharacterized protein n=1 Tax=Portunus trituberculatus TaxID=210409 RepID=A0A5B7E671_PORTR|nr:hypothetical protein [Portunus trituberculatus]
MSPARGRVYAILRTEDWFGHGFVFPRQTGHMQSWERTRRDSPIHRLLVRGQPLVTGWGGVGSCRSPANLQLMPHVFINHTGRCVSSGTVVDPRDGQGVKQAPYV